MLNGCNIPKTPLFDSDKDGVPNYKDACPNTPALAKVNRYGCAIDSDLDGVIDLYDKCPNTPILNLVNKNGCTIKRLTNSKKMVSK